MARGLYYRPSTFWSRPIDREETIHTDTRMLGLTTKHIYFAGSQKRVPDPPQQDSDLRPLRGRVRDHAGRADRQAADLPDRIRLVRLQPGPAPRVNDEFHPEPGTSPTA